ncbi:L,D-transpeptidase family protein [Roseovarius arcticus]|uniref:L,D-transpeptidase family protein n=1 Tax=Roseovarius arcticus TaxID=2547404 RepID=UPI001110F836|nr:L,D-transpeptidase family protein [Roseovarius arcticus]
MKLFKLMAIMLMIVGLSACGSKFKTYKGPQVTHVVVNKTERKMYLLHHNRVLEDYDFDLGFAPAGHKGEEGDGRTPEGTYLIDRRNPNSKFHLSIGISYPNAFDRAQAHARGKSPGGDIFIHGQPNAFKGRNGQDWTAGCIAVKDKEIEWIYAMVRDGTPITIQP